MHCFCLNQGEKDKSAQFCWPRPPQTNRHGKHMEDIAHQQETKAGRQHVTFGFQKRITHSVFLRVPIFWKAAPRKSASRSSSKSGRGSFGPSLTQKATGAWTHKPETRGSESICCPQMPTGHEEKKVPFCWLSFKGTLPKKKGEKGHHWATGCLSPSFSRISWHHV